MNFHFDEATMRQVVSKVLFEELLTEEKKNELIQQAIADLLKEKEVRDGYSTRRVSIITEAFEQSAIVIAREVIRDQVRESPEFKNAVREVMKKAIDLILTDEKIVESAGVVIAGIIEEALRKQTY